MKLKNYLKRFSLLVVTTAILTTSAFAQRAPRKDINTDFTDAERLLLAQYIEEWLTYDIIEDHRVNFSTGTQWTSNFLP